MNVAGRCQESLAKLTELYAIINDDGSLTTHEDHVDICRDGQHALGQINMVIDKLEKSQAELAKARKALEPFAAYGEQLQQANIPGGSPVRYSPSATRNSSLKAADFYDAIKAVAP